MQNESIWYKNEKVAGEMLEVLMEEEAPGETESRVKWGGGEEQSDRVEERGAAGEEEEEEEEEEEDESDRNADGCDCIRWDR